jgi:uncharacterized membrane protein YeaQ/YmgE (transglycosylase-associated protein family)
MSILMTMVLGVVGALIGGLIAGLLGTGDIFELNVLGFILAVVAAFILVGIYAGTQARGRRSVR